ncbi:NACHT and WD repeat domain-containing protein 2-like [Antedon mediterranea]|uniref:NACHT and WD repeat domain-containing protein 2-like n=1 Tax=Antedon mediterranea TaxID=105859 RepID=UPI003AF4F048
MEKILCGRLAGCPSPPSRVVKMIISCNKSDTVQERQMLLKEACPELQRYCEEYGLEFQLVDLHQGPKDLAANDHEAAALRMNEIREAHRISQGPFFVSIIGNKYGECILPVEIESNEFSQIRDCAFESGKDVNLLDEWYLPRGEGANCVYVLQPMTSHIRYLYDQTDENKEQHEKDVTRWRKTYESLLDILQQSSEYIHDEGLVKEKELQKYHMSALECELTQSLALTSDPANKCICIFRNLEGMPQSVDSQEMHSYIDLRKATKPKILKKAQEQIKVLKEVRIPAKVASENILKFSVKWTPVGISPNNEEHNTYLKQLCNKFVTTVKGMIDKQALKDQVAAYQRRPDEMRKLQNEVMKHLEIAKKHCEIFINRDSIMSQVKSLVQENSADKNSSSSPIVLYGDSGSGKSAVLSQIIKLSPEWLGDSVVNVIRYFGATTDCKTIHGVLYSICQQIMKVYKPKGKTRIPQDLTDLLAFFTDLVKTAANTYRPLMIVLDIPSDITSNLNAKHIKWLPTDFPASVSVVLSMDGNTPVLKELRNLIPEKNFIKVTSMNDRELSEIVRCFLHKNGRVLPNEQFKILTRALARNPLPLYAKLLCQETQILNSSGNGRDPTSSISDAITALFVMLEEKHGQFLTSTILRYLTCGHNGVTELELLDLLSCNDNLLHYIYPDSLPSPLRFPYQIWAGFKRDVGSLLEERHMDHKSLLTWCNTVIASMATQRYFPSKALKVECHQDFASLFMNMWLNGKPYKPSSYASEDEVLTINRGVAPQPLIYGQTRYNLRCVSELWFHLLHSGNVNQLKSASICNFEFLLAKIHATSVYSLIQDIDTILKWTIDSELDLIRSAIISSASTLAEDPLQLAAELIGRLLPMNRDYPHALQDLVKQAMAWCDVFTRPLLKPIALWLPTPRQQHITTLTCDEDIARVQISNDTQLAYCLTKANKMVVYHIASQEKIGEFPPLGGTVTAYILSQDDRYLLMGCDKVAVLWDAEAMKEVHTFRDHKDVVMCVLISHNVKWLFTGSADATVRVYNLNTGKFEYKLEGHEKAIVGMGINTHDDVLVSCSLDFSFRTWNLDDNSLLDAIEMHNKPITSMTLSKDSTFLLSAYNDCKLEVSCLVTGSGVHSLEGHETKITSISISSDSTYVAVGTIDCKVHVFNMKTTELVQTFTEHTGPVCDVLITDKDYFLISAGHDNQVHVRNFIKPEKKHQISSLHDGEVTCIAISKENSFAVTGGTDCTLKLWNLESNTMFQTLDEHLESITCVAISDDCNYVVSGSEDKTVKIWHIVKQKYTVNFTEHENTISSVMIATDNQRILSADVGNRLKLWEAESSQVLMSYVGPSELVTLTPDNQFAISGDGNELMKIWFLDNGESVKTINHLEKITCITITKDTQFTITGSEDMSLKIWETKSGKLTQILAGHDEMVTCVAVANHNRHVVSGSSDKLLIVWNLSTGETEKTLEGHQDIVTSVKMTSDGTLAVSGSRDGTLRVWSIQHGVMVTAFYLHVPVLELKMTFNAEHILVRVEEGGCAPLLCLHNSTAAEIESQSQVNIDLKDDSSSSTTSPITVPMNKPPPLEKKSSSIRMPKITRKSTSSVNEPSDKKKHSKNRHQSYSDGNSSPGKAKNKRSGVCKIL